MLFIFSTPVLIRRLWQLKTVVFLHWHLTRGVLLILIFTIYYIFNYFWGKERKKRTQFCLSLKEEERKKVQNWRKSFFQSLGFRPKLFCTKLLYIQKVDRKDFEEVLYRRYRNETTWF